MGPHSTRRCVAWLRTGSQLTLGLLACMVASSAVPLHAQPGPDSDGGRPWTLGPRVGVGFSQTRDETLSPLSYRGVQLIVGAAFTHARGPNRHQARLELAPGYKANRFGYAAVFFTQRLDYAYLRALHDDHGRWRFELGPGAGMELDPVLYFDASTDFPYWQTVYDLRLVSRGLYRIDSRRSVELDATLSVVGMASRPPDARFDVGEFRIGDLYTETHTDFGFVSFHNHFFVELRPCYRHHGRGPGSQAVCYGLAARWLREPVPIVTLDNRVDYTFWF